MKKIVVLTGSFNPVTKAHYSIMDLALKHVGGDMGLFVPTNQFYLRKKCIVNPRKRTKFILSKEEVQKYMKNTKDRTGGVRYQASINGYDSYGATSAWFTSTKAKDDYYYYINEDGYIGVAYIKRCDIGLRPAIWINLDKTIA